MGPELEPSLTVTVTRMTGRLLTPETSGHGVAVVPSRTQYGSTSDPTQYVRPSGPVVVVLVEVSVITLIALYCRRRKDSIFTSATAAAVDALLARLIEAKPELKPATSATM